MYAIAVCIRIGRHTDREDSFLQDRELRCYL